MLTIKEYYQIKNIKSKMNLEDTLKEYGKKGLNEDLIERLGFEKEFTNSKYEYYKDLNSRNENYTYILINKDKNKNKVRILNLETNINEHLAESNFVYQGFSGVGFTIGFFLGDIVTKSEHFYDNLPHKFLYGVIGAALYYLTLKGIELIENKFDKKNQESYNQVNFFKEYVFNNKKRRQNF